MRSNLESFLSALPVDADCGDVQGPGWYGLFRGPVTSDCGYPELWAELSDVAGIIVSEDSQGFSDSRLFEDAAELESEWARIESECTAFEDSIDA